MSLDREGMSAAKQIALDYSIGTGGHVDDLQMTLIDAVDDAFVKAANVIGALMEHSPKHDRELLMNAVLALREHKG